MPERMPARWAVGQSIFSVQTLVQRPPQVAPQEPANVTCPLAGGAQAGLKPEQMRAQLGRFGLSGHHHLQPICKLSGGQKARVVFTSIALGCPHILLLDEPTNHLDMQSIDALSDALAEVRAQVMLETEGCCCSPRKKRSSHHSRA